MTIMEKHKSFEYIPREVVLLPRRFFMKKLFLAVLATLSFNAFSQSYFILDNGVTLTVDHKGFVYDYGHYTPVNRVTVKGGQYLVEDTNILVTVDVHFRRRNKSARWSIGCSANLKWDQGLATATCFLGANKASFKRGQRSPYMSA